MNTDLPYRNTNKNLYEQKLLNVFSGTFLTAADAYNLWAGSKMSSLAASATSSNNNNNNTITNNCNKPAATSSSKTSSPPTKTQQKQKFQTTSRLEFSSRNILDSKYDPLYISL